ncbi:MAG: cache domain-containing protein [Proteobacteria bacterium]|nr:cache domain-containing protein [Pseudomonadota bacterium]MBU4294272.1 cache domain-containing protein [Pseudomonadota bacterium]MCG2747429.1 cache domain-containing protein [Desulfobulbaceae bacterium]
MQKNISVIKIFLYSAVTLVVLSSVFGGTITIYSDYREFLSESKIIENKYIEQQKALIKNEVEKTVDYVTFMKSLLEHRVQSEVKNRVYEAYAIAEHIYKIEAGKMPVAEVENLVRESLRPISFLNGRGYFFAVSFDGIEELFADRPEVEGKNMLATQDKEGKFVIQDMISIAKEKGEGFYEYLWTKPFQGERSFPKIAYVKYFKPFNWLIGTGEYLDDMEKDIQKEVLERIAKIRFGQDGYIFVVDFHGKTLMNDTQRELIGVNLWDMTDPNGVKVIQEERKAAEKPDGDFISYVWNKPTQSKPVPKISFVKGYTNWGWMIGAGVYLDDVQTLIAKEKELLKRKAVKQISYILLPMLLSIFLMVLIARLLTRKIEKEFNVFANFFEKASSRAETIAISELHFQEFQRLAYFSNTMVEKQKQADIKRLQAEAEKENIEIKLRQAQKMEAIGTLAGGIAHDFNNILSVILGYAEMAKEDVKPDSDLSEYIDEIFTAGNRAKNLVQQILTFSRQSKVERISLQPQPLIREALKMLRSSIPTTIEIQHDIAEDCGTIKADPTQLYQILMNLCTNAFHAMEQSGGILRITLKVADQIPLELRDETSPERSFIELAISDTGHGIGPDIIDKIFDPFFTTKEQGKGTGMGLSIAYGIIRNYGGTITVDTQLHKGTTFHIYIPRSKGDAAPERLAYKEIPMGKERILLVDDEELLLGIGRRMLERLGYHVTVKLHSFEALELFYKQPDQFDVVITDQTMPGMTGIELARRMLLIRPDIPIILCTGYSSLVDEEVAKQKGIREFAFKPLDKEEIARLIRKVLHSD